MNRGSAPLAGPGRSWQGGTNIRRPVTSSARSGSVPQSPVPRPVSEPEEPTPKIEEPTQAESIPVKITPKVVKPVRVELAPEISSPKVAEPLPTKPSRARPVPLVKTVAPVPKPITAKRKLRLPKQRVNILKFAVPVFALLVISSAVYGFISWGRQPAVSKSAVLAAQTPEEAAGITTNERPVVLFVTDKSKVSQQFLEKAENGDEVRLYYLAKKAVLYRPDSGQVIIVSEFTPPPAKVFVRNGTTGNTRVTKVEKQIKSNAQLEYVSKDRAANTGYLETIVVNVTGRYAAEAEALAAELGAKVESLPEGEIAPQADILVIVGIK